MKSRAPALAIALILALVATGGVFLYVQSVRHTASTGGGMVSVIVSKQDIAAGTSLAVALRPGVRAIGTEPVAAPALRLAAAEPGAPGTASQVQPSQVQPSV